ncbi:MAG: ABC transporter ATP-binding protein [Clostridia bacterium]|nr:ABC transporter ATP-binding protein [Clostridia bacterium]
MNNIKNTSLENGIDKDENKTSQSVIDKDLSGDDKNNKYKIKKEKDGNKTAESVKNKDFSGDDKNNKNKMKKEKKVNDHILLRLVKEAKKIRAGILFGSLLSVLVIACNMAAPRLVSMVIEEMNKFYLLRQSGGVVGSLIASVTDILLITFAVYASKGVLQYLKMLVMNFTVSRHFTCAIRIQMSDKIKSLPVSYVDKTQPGELLSRMTSDVSIMGNTIHNIVDTVMMGVIQVVGVAAMMFIVNWELAFVVIAIVPLSIFLAILISKRSEKHFEKLQAKVEKMYTCVEETYSGYATIKAYNVEEAREKQAREINREIYDSEKKGITISSMVGPLITLTNSIAYVLICLIGGYLAVQGSISLGGVVAIILYSKQFAAPLEQISEGISSMQRVKAASRRVYQMLDQEEMKEISGDMPKEIKGNVKFDKVSFSYSPDKSLIEDLNFEVKKGQKVAIVGPTGAGKTTIVNLLMRFYDIQKGIISIDGVDISKVSRESVRDLFSMVLQDTWLFKGTIFENVAYAKDGATREDVIAACDSAYADHFIRTFPKGYDTEIDEGTSNISGGQKQLITIARAFLSERSLLILDEATSNVDTRTEILIQKAMDKLMKNKTAFVIAHRLSTIVNSDLILVIDNGSIVEIGTHKSLLEKNGFYAEIYNSQYAN